MNPTFCDVHAGLCSAILILPPVQATEWRVRQQSARWAGRHCKNADLSSVNQGVACKKRCMHCLEGLRAKTSRAIANAWHQEAVVQGYLHSTGTVRCTANMYVIKVSTVQHVEFSGIHESVARNC